MAHRTTRTATRLALALVGAGLATTGVVLLLRAAWVTIAVPLGPVWASVIMGSALVLIGALLLALSAQSPPRPARSDDDLIVRITTAFFEGLAAGRARRDR